MHVSCPRQVLHVDLLIYSDRGTRALLSHCRSGDGNFELPVPAEDAVFAAVANLPGELNTGVLGNLDKLEHISMPYSRENPEFPVMSGTAQVDAGSTRVELNLLPLLCSIRILGIDSSLGQRLEDPQLYLKGANESAGIFRTDGFHPSRTLDSAEGLEHPEMMLLNLPTDLGMNRVETDFTLYCYPNEDAFPGTSICIGGDERGELREYSAPTGPLYRAENVKYTISLGNGGMFLEPLP